MTTLKKRILTMVMVLALLFSQGVPFFKDLTLKAGAINIGDIEASLARMRDKYPTGEVWTGTYDGASECMGFALMMGADMFGVSPRKWETSTTVNDLCIGDYVRYRSVGWDHSIFIINIINDTVYYVDCNAGSKYCEVNWDRPVAKSTLQNKINQPLNQYPTQTGFILHMPGNNATSLRFFDFWGDSSAENRIISGMVKFWFKQTGYYNQSNLDVNIYMDGKEIQNALGTIYMDTNGFFSININTEKYINGQHIIFAVLRTSGVEVWVQRTVILNNTQFFDFWGDSAVDNRILSGKETLYFKEAAYYDLTSIDVNIHLDGKSAANALGTVYMDANGYFSFNIDTERFANGQHTIFAVLRTNGVEKWVQRSVVFMNSIDISKATISVISAQIYTGSALTPAVTVKYGTTTLQEDTDYTIAYSDNINAGSATITVTGKGNYTGSVVKTFMINKAAGAEISGPITGYYTGDGVAFAYTVNAISNAEYSCDANIWQEGNVFTSMIPGSTVTFYARIKADSNHEAGTAKYTSPVTFAKLVNIAVPDLNYSITVTGGDVMITIAFVIDAEYSFDGGLTWSGVAFDSDGDGVADNGANSKTFAKNTAVTIAIRYAVTATHFASEAAQSSVRASIVSPVNGTSTVINSELGYIYGLEGLKSSINSFVKAAEGYELDCHETVNGLGTGAVVNVIKEGLTVESYTIVIFGDTTGNGLTDGCDGVVINLIIEMMLTKEDVGDAVWYAADANHDGLINHLDADLLEKAGLLLTEVSQVPMIDT